MTKCDSTTPACIGRCEPDPAGQILGTGYMRFESPSGIDGLAKWNGTRLDLLAVLARTQDKGQFREFIQQCQRDFDTVCVWHDFNPMVGKALERYGFTPEQEIDGLGEALIGWRWDRKK